MTLCAWLVTYKRLRITHGLHQVRINYGRVSLSSCRLHTVNITFGQGKCLRLTTSKDTTRIARAHQHRNRERHSRYTRRVWREWEYRLNICRVTRGAHIECI
jgi:hypothetical protein